MKNEHPAFFPPNRTILELMNMSGIAVIELQFYSLFLDSDRLCVAYYRLNSLND